MTDYYPTTPEEVAKRQAELLRRVIGEELDDWLEREVERLGEEDDKDR